MSGNLKLEMRLTANTSQLSTALNNAGNHVKGFANSANAAASKMVGGFKKVYEQLNGFSVISKLAVAAGGYSLLSDALARNLEFEKTLLDMKQTAEMTTAQAAEMRSLAIDAASRNLALPGEIAIGLKAFSASGMKFDQIKGSIDEAARAAVAFRASVEQVALLDFDLQDKMKLDPAQIKDAHNMLLYHAKSGRYEAAPMATEAPKYLNSVASVGIGGMKGLNFTGAMTQILMKLAPATQPNEVATFMEHGLGHITSKHQVKGLQKFGIDVKKYMPDGKFYGEGGVQGALDLAQEMKAKGLDNPFKLDEAGFREMYTKKFWKQMMAYQSEIKQAMNEGAKAASNDMVGQDKAEIMRSNFGKVKQFQITKEKAQVSDGATAAVGKWASVQGWAAENPMTALAGGTAAAIGGRLLWKKVKGGTGSALEKAVGAVGGAGMPVMVTNWPADFGSKLKASERMEKFTKPVTKTTAAAQTGKKLVSGALTLGAVAIAAAPFVAIHEYRKTESGQRTLSDGIGREIKDLQRSLKVELNSGLVNPETVKSYQRQIAELEQRRSVIDKKLAANAPAPPATKVVAQVVPTQEAPINKLAQVAKSQETPVNKLTQVTQLPVAPGNLLNKTVQPPPVHANKFKEVTTQAAIASNVNANRWKLEIDQLERRINTSKSNGDKELLVKLEKQRTELSAKLDSVIRELQGLGNRPVQVSLDSRPIVAAVNTANGRDARRQ